MLWQKDYPALGLLGCCVLLLSTTTITADNSVHILSKYTHQPLTSTTLKWLPVSHYDQSKEIVIGGFENVPDGEGAREDALKLSTVCTPRVSPAVQRRTRRDASYH